MAWLPLALRSGNQVVAAPQQHRSARGCWKQQQKLFEELAQKLVQVHQAAEPLSDAQHRLELLPARSSMARSVSEVIWESDPRAGLLATRLSANCRNCRRVAQSMDSSRS